MKWILILPIVASLGAFAQGEVGAKHLHYASSGDNRLIAGRKDGSPLTEKDLDCLHRQLEELAAVREIYEPNLGVGGYDFQLTLGGRNAGAVFAESSLNIKIGTDRKRCAVVKAQKLLSISKAPALTPKYVVATTSNEFIQYILGN